jgi:hypothetical protein
VQPERKRSAVNWRPLATAALTMAAALGCVAHWNWIHDQTTRLERRLTELAIPAADKKRYDSELVKLLEEQSKLEADSLTATTELKRVQFFLQHQTDRSPKLLQMLIDLRSPEMVIQQLTPDKNGLVVGGISLNGEATQALANKLRSLTTPLGWKVAGVRQEGEQKMTSGGPWNFQVTLQDIGPFDAPPAVERAVTSVQNNDK